MNRRSQAGPLLAVAATLALGLAMACSGTPSSPSGAGGGTGGGGTGGDGTGGGTPPPPPTPPPTPPPNPTGQTVTVIGVGDIGWCGSLGTPATAKLVAGLEGQIILGGDIAYPDGSAANFRDCFEPTWGQFRSRWRPVPGNHEYQTPNAAGYFAYFGSAAGPAGRGYYSFQAGEWLILMLDSNIPVSRGSPQWEFARQQLDAHRSPCAMAVWHHPLFTSAQNGPNPYMRDMWSLLETAKVEVVLNGHDHVYERFARQMADGRPDPVNGIRQFTVGTGGADLYRFVTIAPNSEARIASQFGVLRMTLQPGAIRWDFMTTNGGVQDPGLDTCR